MREDGARFGKTRRGGSSASNCTRSAYRGARMNLVLTPANWDDRDPALALTEGADGGVTIGDLGYRGPDAPESGREPRCC